MAHFEQMFFFDNVRAFFPSYFQRKKVLEIGSLDINGSVRGFFKNCDYKGIDIGPGPKVDQVCRGEDFPDKAKQYDVVISTEVFEHTEDWDLILLNMMRLMKRDGMLMFSCASWGRGQHGTTLCNSSMAPHVASSSDYYKNLIENDFRLCLQLDYWFSDYEFILDVGCIYFVGFGRIATQQVSTINEFKKVYKEYLHNKNILGLPHDYIMGQAK